MRAFLWVVAAAALGGCGDDGAAPPDGGGAGGGSSSSGVETTVSSQTGTGGAGGVAPKAEDGAPCADADDCAGGVCLLEVLAGYPGGFCVSRCDLGAPESCAGICTRVAPFGDVCKPDCLEQDGVCRDAYTCHGAPAVGYTCSPFCMDAADCPVTGICEELRCVAPETPFETDCEDLLDDDDDTLVDCADPDCRASAACAPGSTPLGGPCTAHSDCVAPGGVPFCLSEAATGQPGGACAEPCSSIEGSHCTVGSYCSPARVFETAASAGATLWHCPLTACSASEPCREGYRCSCEADCPPMSPGACRADCTSDAECTVAGHTCEVGGATTFPVCVAPPLAEACDNGQDDDHDDDSDCEDDACATFCADIEAQLCASAPTLAASQSGATAPGPGIGGRGCVPSSSVGRVSPRAYRYQAPSSGTLRLTLQSVYPQALRLVNGCDIDATTGLAGQTDQDIDGLIEIEAAVVAAGTYTVLVWPAAPGHEDTFTLGSELVQ